MRSRSTASTRRSPRRGPSDATPSHPRHQGRTRMLDVKVPDIGDYKDVPVIDVLVKPGDTVAVDDPLVTLESDKATMDVPSPSAGVVKSIVVKVGDKVSEGSVVLQMDAGGATAAAPAAPAPKAAPNGATSAVATAPAQAFVPGATLPGEGPSGNPPLMATTEVKVPDIGDYTDVPVIEVFVKPGDIVKLDDPLVMLESDKATMEVPATVAGVIQGVRVAVGDKVSEGTVIASVSARSEGSAIVAAPVGAPAAPQAATPARAAAPATTTAPAAPAAAAGHPPPVVDPTSFKAAHASPSVRLFARELGVDLTRVTGSGPKGRIVREDVQGYVKQALKAPPAAAAAPAGGSGLNLQPWPNVDFTKYGPVDVKPLSRIKKISGANLARNWVMIPHVTQFDEADITDLEALRVALNKENEKTGPKVTMLAFLIKASVAALKRFPDFNASLVSKPDGDELVLKQYFHVGFAADTPNGLVVPVIRDADKKGVLAIAKEMGELSAKARDGKLTPAEMQGGCFSISSLGGIGGTAFTPIINAPEVAILGVSKSTLKPVWDGKAFVPRLTLPLSLSYDHRVIDGAAAARFTAYYSALLADMRRSLL
ncbi:MAG: dihydrolipoyllysine-residue acetyltransferase [Proteobacteria bacterium]|nr:dihydrolipoyllysine-residue acetyltransferase [Pseudomonadota bacterium]